MKIQEGVSLQFIGTTKFKDIGINIRFLSTLETKKAAMRSLLALMLCDRCLPYDTKQKMSIREDELYGATLNAQTAGFGKAQVIEIRSKIINPSYLKKGNTVLADVFDFLHDIIFSPLLNDSTFEESKNMLLAKIERMLDEPSQSVIHNGLKTAGKGTPLGISALGELEDVKEITLSQVQQAYKEMIEEDQIDVIVCGDVDETEIINLVKKSFPFSSRQQTTTSYYRVENEIDSSMETAYRNISQSYIMMIWFTNCMLTDKEYYALRVANAMFGQYSTSLLFQEVREKNSLCYSIYSNLISYDGALVVTTGIEQKNIQKTIDLVHQQFDCLKDGDFDDTLMTVSKKMIVNSLRASNDSMNSLIALAYQNKLLKEEMSSQDIIEAVEQVQKEDVIKAIRKCIEKFTFVVTKEEVHEEDN